MFRSIVFSYYLELLQNAENEFGLQLIEILEKKTSKANSEYNFAISFLVMAGFISPVFAFL